MAGLAVRSKRQPTLGGAELERVRALAAPASFQAVAALPAILLIVFGAIWLYDRSKGGHKAVKLS